MASKKFKNFDILVNPPSDHHYINAKFEGGPSTKRISKEWKMLSNGLPDSIFVRAYEKQMNLLRAVIVGAHDTPYSDGLFFFDIMFPTDYPDSPPVVHFHSHGMRLNPNLYKDGHVCLSLLNTWSGRKEEKWNRKVSTVLQLLVSLQGLVLNAEPLYNEPVAEIVGFFMNWQSSIYSRKTFMLKCKAIVYTLRKPPLHFRYFVREHFLERAYDILVSCKAYLCMGKSMIQLLDELAFAFEEVNGTSFQYLVDQIKREELTRVENIGLLAKLWNTVENFLSFIGF